MSPLLSALRARLVPIALSVCKPVKALKAVTDRLAAGDERRRERDRAGHELQQSEDRYRLLFALSPHPMWVYDVATLEFLEVNEAAVRHYGYSRAEFLAMRITDIRPPDDVPRLLATLAAEREPFRVSSGWRHRLKSGAIINVDVASHHLTFAGRPAALVTTLDVTDRTRAEAALAERTAITALTADVGVALNRPHELPPCLRSCAESVVAHLDTDVAGVWTFNQTDNILELVASAGMDSDIDETQRRVPIGESTVGRVAQTRRAYFTNDTIEDAEVHDRAWLRRDGMVAFAACPLVVKSRVVGVMAFAARHRMSDAVMSGMASVADVIALGITRHQAEERIRLLARALESTNEMVSVTDVNDRFTFVNSAFLRAYGYTAEEVIGRTPALVRTADTPADVAEAIAQESRRNGWKGELTNRRKDGTEFIISLNTSAIRDDRNRIVGLLGVARDMTEHRSLEEQLRQSQKMEAVGQLAGGVAHDFNNLLTAIQGFAGFLAESLDESDERRADVDEIRHAADRAASLTRQLLAFSRKQIMCVRVLHVGDVVGELTSMLRRLLGEAIDLKTTIGDHGVVKADPGQLQQVLVNLAVNAHDAMRDGGRLTIETADVVLDETFARHHPSVRPGPHVMLAVTDTGHGMDAATQKRIFEPFFTTKPQGKGTGLGLATVYGIVKQSGGSIWVSSEMGRGTTFKVYLPRTDELEEADEPALIDTRLLRGTETILLVEDEHLVREFTHKVLTRLGYAVHALADPRRAIEYAAAHGGKIDLVFTDVVLPDMSGRSMVTHLLQRHPESKVLYMSGYDDHAIVQDGVLESGMSFLQKPFTADAVASKIREVLDGGSPRIVNPQLPRS